MAETVKKSRIVSDDDLEETLMQEFNMRLKNCMSHEDTNEPDEEEPEKNEDDLYENVRTIKTNGKTGITITLEDSSEVIYDQVSTMSSGAFIEIEKRFCDENFQSPGVNGFGENASAVGVAADVELDLAQVKTDVEHDDQFAEINLRQMVEILESNYEDVQKPDLDLPTTCFTDMCDEDAEAQEAKSVKDRMFLSTDDASCLLFTQTVTSPMLTPSEENIDFLKGFRRQSSQNTISDNTNSNSNGSPKCEDEERSEAATESTNDSERVEVGSDKNFVEYDKNEVEYDNAQQIGTDSDLSDTAQNVAEPTYEDIEISTQTNQKMDVKLACSQFIENERENEIDRGRVEEDDIYDNVDPPTAEQLVHPTKFQDDAIAESSIACDLVQETSNVGEEVENAEVLKPDVVPEVSTPSSEEMVELDIEESQTNGKSEERGVLSDDDDEDKLDNPSKMVDALKTKFMTNVTAEIVKTPSIEKLEITQLKTVDIMKQISKFEKKSPTTDDDTNEFNIDSTETTESSTYVETTTVETKSSTQDKSLKKKKSKKSRKSHEKENISVTDINTDTNTQEENFYNVNVKNLRTRSLSGIKSIAMSTDAESVFHGVSVKALKEVFNVSHEGATNRNSVVRVHVGEKIERLKSSFNKFDALQKKNVLHVRSSDSSKAQEKFNGSAPIDTNNCKACGKVVFQMEQTKAEKSIWHKNCFRCNECSKQLTVDTYQSHEGGLYCKPHFKALFAPKVVEDEAPPSDKPDLGLEELQSLNVKERFQVFEHHEDANSLERTPSAVNVKRSPSILSKLAKFQSKGMDIGVTDDSLNGIPIEESSSEEEAPEEELEGEDADLIRAKKAQKEKPFHFVQMSDVKSKWEHGEQNSKDERREERKQEIQSIRNRLFMGKQGKMKEAYQQAVMDSESGNNVKKPTADVEACDTRTLKQKFEMVEVYAEDGKSKEKDAEDMSVFESGISKKSRSIFLELDANASKAPQLSPVSPPKPTDVRKTKEVFLARQPSEDVVKSSEQVDDVKIQTSDIQQRFKFFETYKEPEKTRKAFRITPPREGQVKSNTPEREVYRDPEIVRGEEQIEDSVIAKETHTATKVLNKFRQMEENLNKEPLPLGPKPLKRFTPPPEPTRNESSSEGDASESEEESEECDEIDHSKVQDADLLEAQKAARAKQLRAKFERWEASEIKREQSVNIVEEIGEDQAQIESTKSLRARFESLKDSSNDMKSAPRVKVNRFVESHKNLEICEGCKGRVYPLEKISIHGHLFHKKCFKCMECNSVLRMDSYTYNQGLLYCVPHFKRLFISKGNYDTAFGLEQHKEKWNATVA